jgi:hypothetical protein
MFVISDDLVYYSSELKQYATDVAIALLCTLAALRVLEQRITARRVLGLSVLAAIAPWFSHASAFVIAGVGTVLLGNALAARRWREAVALLAPTLLWSASFAASYVASRVQLSQYTTMFKFWEFSFLPLPPRSVADWRLIGCSLLDVFVNPLDLVVPAGGMAALVTSFRPDWSDLSQRMVVPALPWISVVPPIIYLTLGGTELLRRRATAAQILILPIMLAILASGLRKYPFHGRIILFLAPALLLLIANGVDLMATKTGRRWVFPTLSTLLLLHPCLSTTYGVNSMHQRESFLSHGDLRIDVFCSTPDNEPEKFFKRGVPRRGAESNSRQQSAPHSRPQVDKRTD